MVYDPAICQPASTLTALEVLAEPGIIGRCRPFDLHMPLYPYVPHAEQRDFRGFSRILPDRGVDGVRCRHRYPTRVEVSPLVEKGQFANPVRVALPRHGSCSAYGTVGVRPCCQFQSLCYIGMHVTHSGRRLTLPVRRRSEVLVKYNLAKSPLYDCKH